MSNSCASALRDSTTDSRLLMPAQGTHTRTVYMKQVDIHRAQGSGLRTEGRWEGSGLGLRDQWHRA